MKKPLICISFLSAVFFFILLFTSCVKDVDLDQYNEIAIKPKAALDLVFFELTSEDFSNHNNDLRAADDTRLDFLDDDYIQNNLLRTDLNFRFTNSFETEFVAVVRLLSESNAVQHEIQIPIPAGTGTSPAKVDFTDIIYENQIGKIRRSIKISVEIITQDSTVMDGELQLQSRALFYFEF